jgi:hypothetical protein
VDQAVKTEGVQNVDVSRTAPLCHLRNGPSDGGKLTDARLLRSAELMSPLPLLQRLLDEFFDEILAMESCIGGKLVLIIPASSDVSPSGHSQISKRAPTSNGRRFDPAFGIACLYAQPSFHRHLHAHEKSWLPHQRQL